MANACVRKEFSSLCFLKTRRQSKNCYSVFSIYFITRNTLGTYNTEHCEWYWTGYRTCVYYCNGLDFRTSPRDVEKGSFFLPRLWFLIFREREVAELEGKKWEPRAAKRCFSSRNHQPVSSVGLWINGTCLRRERTTGVRLEELIFI